MAISVPTFSQGYKSDVKIHWGVRTRSHESLAHGLSIDVYIVYMGCLEVFKK